MVEAKSTLKRKCMLEPEEMAERLAAAEKVVGAARDLWNANGSDSKLERRFKNSLSAFDRLVSKEPADG